MSVCCVCHFFRLKKLLILPLSKDEVWSTNCKKITKESIRKDIGIKFRNFGSEMVKNCRAENSFFFFATHWCYVGVMTGDRWQVTGGTWHLGFFLCFFFNMFFFCIVFSCYLFLCYYLHMLWDSVSSVCEILSLVSCSFMRRFWDFDWVLSDCKMRMWCLL